MGMGRNVARRPVLIVGSLLVLAAGCAGPAEREAREAIADPGAPGPYARQPAAEAPDSAPLPVLGEDATLQDCLDYAQQNNPGLEAALNRWKAAAERIPQARSLPDPSLNYELEAMPDRRQHMVTLNQMFPWPEKLSLGAAVAREEAEAARQQYEAAKVSLFFRVKDAYYEYYYLGRAVAVVRENRDLVKYLEEVARTRYKAGAAGHPDVIRAQVELGKLDDQLRTLEDLRGAAAARVNAALNRPAEAPLAWPTSVPLEPVEASDAEVLAWLGQASPELKALDHEVAREQEAVALARKDYLPDFMVGAGYMREQMSGGGEDGVTVMTGITLPIWREKYAASVREARARHEAALRARTDRANTLGAEVKMTLYRFRDAERKINLYRDTLLPKAREALKATEASFRVGQAAFTDLIDAQRIFLEFQLAGERALADHAQRRAELEMLVGRALLPRAAAESVAGPEGPQTKNENQEGEK
jgi:outer membrane protein TolC